jgi:glycosyltransferase involved in cell wall biosynthesis
MTGYVDDRLLPALYSGAISSVYLSYYEGFGLPPLESLACGTPVIASNISSLQEVVGAAGLLVNPCDEDEIAFNILRVVEDSNLRSHLSQSGIDRLKLFNWDKTALQTWNVLNQCQKA